MSKKGIKVVDEIPPPKRPRRSGIDWDGPAQTARATGQPVLAATGVPESTVKSIRYYKRDPFMDSTGKIVATMRNSEVGEDGIRRGDVYFQWESNLNTNQKEN
ncbi:hypothetical protein SEA_BRUHMOMENT_83 [Arthrobacter phage BruhMoment]|nr:hypothetical protein SEA_BRUHMOMENT_83 [Arthrobacter phage BruhMoment]